MIPSVTKSGVHRKDRNRLCLDGDVDKERSYQDLPEDLVERIIAMMPFPQILKARELSRSWLVRFSPLSSQDDKTKKELARGFQKLVSERSKTWNIVCSCSLSEEFCLSGYDWASCTSTKFPLSWAPEFHISSPSWTLEGSLLLIHSAVLMPRLKGKFYVANILTGSYKLLPPPPDAPARYVVYRKILTDNSMLFYKVLMISISLKDGHFAEIYDSRTELWDSNKILSLRHFEYKDVVFLDGSFYFLMDFNCLFTLNVDNGTTEILDLLGDDISIHRYSEGHLVLSNGYLFLVLGVSGVSWDVVTIDLDSRKFLKVAVGPPGDLEIDPMHMIPFGYGDRIYLGVEKGSPSRTLVYNVAKHEWECCSLPCRYGLLLGCICEPGLNPFIEV